MKKLLILLFAFSMTSIATMQAPVVIGPTDAIGFDYSDALFTSEAITRFEAQYDVGQWTSLGMPTKTPSTVAGFSTYKVIPPQTTGTHTVVFRSCNVIGCNPVGNPPFAFILGSVPAGVPTNLRKIPR